MMTQENTKTSTESIDKSNSLYVYDRDKDYPIQTLCETLHRVFVENDAFLAEDGWSGNELESLENMKETLNELIDDTYDDEEERFSAYDIASDLNDISEQMKTLIDDSMLVEAIGYYRNVNEDFFRIRSDANNASWWLYDKENKTQSFAVPLANDIQEFLHHFERAMYHETSYFENILENAGILTSCRPDTDTMDECNASAEKMLSIVNDLYDAFTELVDTFGELELCYNLVEKIIRQWKDVAENIENYPWYVIEHIMDGVRL